MKDAALTIAENKGERKRKRTNMSLNLRISSRILTTSIFFAHGVNSNGEFHLIKKTFLFFKLIAILVLSRLIFLKLLLE